MIRTTPPSRRLAALLAVALLALAVGPATATVADALGDDARTYCERMGHTMPSEVPDEAPADPQACCVSAPEVPRDAVVPSSPTDLDRSVTAVLTTLALSVRVARTPLRATDPPPGPRRHLILSVFLV